MPYKLNKIMLALFFGAATTLPLHTHAKTNGPADNNAAQPSQSQHQQVQFTVKAGTLDQALNHFAQQAGISLAINGELTAEKMSNGLQGQYSITQGFEKLLIHSQLKAKQEQNGSYILIEHSSTKINTLATAQVIGISQETATGPVKGYAATRSGTGTKTDTPLIETPQTITVVGAQEINVRKAQSLMDVFGYSAGIVRLEGADKTTDSFMIRGFQAGAGAGSIYRDGKRYMANAYDGGQEPFGLERVELLKGAASLLYGASAPGGIINTISKRPIQDTIAEVGLEIGDYNRKQLTADFSGAIAEGSDWSYRLTLLERDSDSFIDYVPDDRTYIAPALKWQVSADTSLTLLSHYQKSTTAYIYGLPAEGTILPNPNGDIPRDRFIGEPGEDNYESENISLGYLFDHNFTEQFSIHHSLNYFEADVAMPNSWIWGFKEDMRHTDERALQERQDDSSVLTSDTYINYILGNNNLSHTITAGFDISQLEHSSERYDRSLESLDLYTPEYGKTIGDSVKNPYSSKSETDRLGLYIQDQIKIQKEWVISLGLRQEWFDFQESAFFGETNWHKEKTDALTGNAGLVYLADNGLAPFISYSQSFELQGGKDRHDNRFDPTQGEQIETGLRFQPENEAWLLSASIYQLVQTKVLVDDPVDSDFSVQTGEVTSKGFELEFKGRLTDDLQVISAYAYTDARTTKDNQPENINKRSGAVPYNQLSVWADYQFNQFNLSGLTVGAGARYVGETRGLWVDGEVPDFTLIDAMISYETTHWRYALNVSNLTDETYVASCTYDCFYGEGRKIIASVNYNF